MADPIDADGEYAPGPEHTRAAHALLHADYLLVLTGAGMSADAGLPVYRDVARVDAYKRRGLDYADLCDPSWIEEDLSTFLGFWGSCYNSYVNVDLHDGYRVLERWRTELFGCAQRVEAKKQAAALARRGARNRPVVGSSSSRLGRSSASASSSRAGPSRRGGGPGERFFVFTSNVDALHSHAGVPDDCLYEIHGNILTWQCSLPCRRDFWQVPRTLRFQVDPGTMRCDRKGGAPTEAADCVRCGRAARPCILMFDDDSWVEPDDSHYDKWKSSLRKALRVDPTKRLVVLEIGAGVRIPTVRAEASSYAKGRPAQVTHVRINVDHPRLGAASVGGVSLKEPALDALRKIDNAIRAAMMLAGGSG